MVQNISDDGSQIALVLDLGAHHLGLPTEGCGTAERSWLILCSVLSSGDCTQIFSLLILLFAVLLVFVAHRPDVHR